MSPWQKPSVESKMLLSFGLIFVSSAYAVWQTLGGQLSITITTAPANPASTSPATGLPQGNIVPEPVIVPTPVVVPKPVVIPKPTPTPVPTPTPAPIPVPPKSVGLYRDGSYTGNATDAFYGIVQVLAVVQGGRLTGVQFLQYPNERNTSRQINNQAMPLLTQEAIAVQSANVDGVSGATFTSQAFKESLASALALAKN